MYVEDVHTEVYFWCCFMLHTCTLYIYTHTHLRCKIFFPTHAQHTRIFSQHGYVSMCIQKVFLIQKIEKSHIFRSKKTHIFRFLLTRGSCTCVCDDVGVCGMGVLPAKPKGMCASSAYIQGRADHHGVFLFFMPSLYTHTHTYIYIQGRHVCKYLRTHTHTY